MLQSLGGRGAAWFFPPPGGQSVYSRVHQLSALATASCHPALPTATPSPRRTHSGSWPQQGCGTRSLPCVGAGLASAKLRGPSMLGTAMSPPQVLTGSGSSLLVPRSLEALPVRAVQPPAGVPTKTLKSSPRGLTGSPISLDSLQPHPPSGFVPRPSRTQTRSLRSLPWGPSQDPWAVPICVAGYASSGLLGHNRGSQ